jgi:hypothetical protein
MKFKEVKKAANKSIDTAAVTDDEILSLSKY